MHQQIDYMFNMTNSGEKLPENTVLIRFQDCDPNQHLNNASYINYMINAREDHIREYYGLDIFAFAKENGLIWFVTQNQIAYFRPAHIMERVTIQSQLIRLGEKSISVEIRMYDEHKKSLKAVLWSQFTHFNMKTNKTEVHSKALIDLFEGVNMPVAEHTFEERIAALRNSARSV